ncbi:MAG: PilN domain-containing protein [bacterium]|nr:PilN domain-containing protein [bacterium]
MREVNLARRPFVNRRPVFRLALLLWILGVAFAVVNYRLYSGHWSGTAKNRQRIVEVDQQIAEQRRLLGDLDRDLARINLPRENRRTDFLNALISYRTFPWSALFDDLEEVVPLDVRLLSVQPQVKLVAEPTKARRPRRARSSRRQPPPSTAAQTAAAQTATEPQPLTLKRNEVALSLKGVAKTEDALMEFIDVLYTSPDFRRPFLSGEISEQGKSNFNLTVVYLTRPLVLSETEESEGDEPSPAEEPAAQEEAPDGIDVAEATGAEPAAMTEDDEDSDTATAEKPPQPDPSLLAAKPRDPPAAAAPAVATPPPTAPPPPTARRPPPPTRRPTTRPTPGDQPSTRPVDGRAGRSTPPAAPPRTVPTQPDDVEPPPEDGFAEPNASATPRLQNGSLPLPQIPEGGTISAPAGTREVLA